MWCMGMNGIGHNSSRIFSKIANTENKAPTNNLCYLGRVSTMFEIFHGVFGGDKYDFISWNRIEQKIAWKKIFPFVLMSFYFTSLSFGITH